jgi:hypothetical protein
MAFNPEIHQIKLIVIKCGEELRKARGLPEERNITTLYEEASSILGIPTIQTTTQDADHYPAPHEMKDEGGKFIVPRKDCPQCGKKDSMLLGPLCKSCEDSEGGKYKSMYQCGEKDRGGKIIPETGCGHKEKFKEHFVQICNELGVDFKGGTKESMGIRTYTDDGLK